MTTVEFKLDMPSRGSWDGRWSGQDKNFTLVRELDDAKAAQIAGRTWSYNWSDGWCAQISARVMTKEEPVKTSHGFHGYAWMVDSILRYGNIFADHERPDLTP